MKKRSVLVKLTTDHSDSDITSVLKMDRSLRSRLGPICRDFWLGYVTVDQYEVRICASSCHKDDPVCQQQIHQNPSASPLKLSMALIWQQSNLSQLMKRRTTLLVVGAAKPKDSKIESFLKVDRPFVLKFWNRWEVSGRYMLAVTEIKKHSKCPVVIKTAKFIQGKLTTTLESRLVCTVKQFILAVFNIIYNGRTSNWKHRDQAYENVSVCVVAEEKAENVIYESKVALTKHVFPKLNEILRNRFSFPKNK